MGKEGLFNATWIVKAISDAKAVLVPSIEDVLLDDDKSAHQAHIEVIWGKYDWMVPAKGRGALLSNSLYADSIILSTHPILTI